VQVTSIQALDPVHDLALLNIKGSEIPPAIKKPRRKVDLTKEKLFFVGYPNGKLKAMGQKGTIEIFESKNHAEIYMPVFTSDIGGASGSPVVNQKGELVGALHSASNIERKIIFSKSDSLFSLQNAEYGVQCSKNTSIKDCFQQAEDFHLKEAQKGDAFVQYKLSLYFRTFYKYIKHLKWLNKAAQQGFVLAQNELGHQFFVHKIYKKAAKWFELGSQKGHIVPTFLLALMYYQGDGVPQDSKKSFELFKLAAQKGHREAYYFLGLMYHRGDGVPQDTKKAFEYFEQAAKQGYREAYHSLDVTHRDGQRVYRNEKKYFEYFKLAVQEKDSTVQKYLKKLSKNKKCIEVFNKGDHS
ncbi:MAG: bifunctional trypsin-like peptidase domain-containing/SEL1-like repeat protein, partial [Bdellovibrionales bacterium]